MLWILRITGFVLARLPLSAMSGVAAVAGSVIFLVSRKRRRGLLSNLRHAFPDRDYTWVAATGRESVRQMVEFGLLATALPCFTEKRLREIFFLSPESSDFLRERTATGRPVVALAPHVGPQDGLSLLPFLAPEMAPIGAIYRPLSSDALDTWIRRSRERFGLKLFSRKRGVQEAIRLLKANQWLGLLFDQNSGGKGALITFFDRVVSATDLPGILASRHQADVVFLYAVRRSFWRIELCAAPGPATHDKDEITFAANLWLEELLRKNEELLPSWLWAHNRWRHQRVPRLSLRAKKNLLQKQNAFLGRPETPRREPFFIRLPDQLYQTLQLLPLLREIRESRPDARITVIGTPNVLPVVKDRGLCEEAIALPPHGPGYFLFFWRLRPRFPAVQILFTESLRADLEAWLMGAPHRFGIARPGKRRRLLNHPWPLPEDLRETDADPTPAWQAFLRAQQLEEPVAQPEDSKRSSASS